MTYVLWDHIHGGVITSTEDEATMRGYVQGYVYRGRMPDWLSLTIPDGAESQTLTGSNLRSWLDPAPGESSVITNIIKGTPSR